MGQFKVEKILLISSQHQSARRDIGKKMRSGSLVVLGNYSMDVTGVVIGIGDKSEMV